MMYFNILFPIELFCILLFSKTFGQVSVNDVKVVIRYHLFGIENLNKLLKWNERFELDLYQVRVELQHERWQPIAKGKTGHYDLATLKIVPQEEIVITKNVSSQQIAIQNAVGEAEWRRKGKEKVEMESGKNMHIENEIKFVLRIQNKMSLNSQTVDKIFERLPNGNEILSCPFNSTPKGCEFMKDKMLLERPIRKILFKVNIRDISFFKKIECTNIKGKGSELTPLKISPVIVEYTGNVCPSDEYTFHLSDDYGRIHSRSFKCDEAIYPLPWPNNYDFSKDKCQLLLIDDNYKDGNQMMKTSPIKHKNYSSSSSATTAMKQLKGTNKSVSMYTPLMLPSPPSNFLNKTSAMNLPASDMPSKQINPGFESQQHATPILQSHPIKSRNMSQSMKAHLIQHAQEIVTEYRQASQLNIQHSEDGTSSDHLPKLDTIPIPQSTHPSSRIENRHPSAISLGIYQGGISKPRQKSASARGTRKNIRPKNSLQSQTFGTEQPQILESSAQHSKQNLPQHFYFDQTNVSHDSSSQIQDIVEQIQSNREPSLPQVDEQKVHHGFVLTSLNIPQPTPDEKPIYPFQSQQQISLASAGSSSTAFTEYGKGNKEGETSANVQQVQPNPAEEQQEIVHILDSDDEQEGQDDEQVGHLKHGQNKREGKGKGKDVEGSGTKYGKK